MHDSKLKSCTYFVNLKKAVDRVQSKRMEWAMRSKKIGEVMVKSVMSLYEEAKTRVRVDTELSECILSCELEAKVECTKDLCCHLYCSCSRRCHRKGKNVCQCVNVSCSMLMFCHDK